MSNMSPFKWLLSPEKCSKPARKVWEPWSSWFGKVLGGEGGGIPLRPLPCEYDSDGNASLLPPVPDLKHESVLKPCSCRLAFLFLGDVVQSVLDTRNGCPVSRWIKGDQRQGKADYHHSTATGQRSGSPPSSKPGC